MLKRLPLPVDRVVHQELRQARLPTGPADGQGVLVARTYVMMDYDIREELLPAAVEITPGMEGPTISPLGRDGAVAVRSMVRKADTNKVMDALYEVGARAILVSPIQAARI